MALLAALGLADDAATRVADLPYGKQRLVEIAIALGLKPKVLLLDEPAAGVPSQRVGADPARRWRSCPRDIAILIIEHDMDLVFRFARRITVLVQGEVLVEGTPDEIARDKRVHDVYLGEGSMADALSSRGVRAGYGETVVLEDVDLALPERGSLAVLGRNGVGKTTLLATIMGHTTLPFRRDSLPNGKPIEAHAGLRALPRSASATCRRSA